MLLCWNAHFLLYSVNSTHTLLNSVWMSLLGSFTWLLPPIQGVPFLCCPSTNDTLLSWSRELSFCPTSPRALLVLYWMYVPRARARAENREGALKRTFHDQMQGRMNATMWLFNSDGVGVINWIRLQQISHQQSSGPGGHEVCGHRKVEKVLKMHSPSSHKHTLCQSYTEKGNVQHLANGRKRCSPFHPILPPLVLFVGKWMWHCQSQMNASLKDVQAWLWVCKSLTVENYPGYTLLSGITANGMLWTIMIIN